MMMYAGVFNSKITKNNRYSTQIASRPNTNESISDVSYESIAPAPATETLLPKRFFFDLGALTEFSSIVRLRFIALRVLLRLVFVSSSSSSSLGSSSLGLYAAASYLGAFRLLLRGAAGLLLIAGSSPNKVERSAAVERSKSPSVNVLARDVFISAAENLGRFVVGVSLSPSSLSG